MNSKDLADARWFKSSRSNGQGACVEVAFVADVAAMRDSKNPAGGALGFGPHAWGAFLHTATGMAPEQ
ncbi:DUF397 domain-containing protein [Actinokineospora iranica]|uniref:DUF397 domain-containing protein n=1 Tax=Actinokineospora iranica TaxID=1271860 RepID=A0A1G6T1G4_9PSEU|nr:protein of unknown function [Actinokineospora iranica]